MAEGVYLKYLANTITALGHVLRPITVVVYYLAIAVVVIVKVLSRPLGFLLQPVVVFGRLLTACLIAPFQLLAKFETLYIYLGIAAIVGLVIGLLVSYAYGSLSSLLRLDSKPEPALGRTAKEYRVAKRTEKAKIEAPIMSSGALSPIAASPNHLSLSDSTAKGKRSKGLLNQTIMEVDSDY